MDSNYGMTSEKEGNPRKFIAELFSIITVVVLIIVLSVFASAFNLKDQSNVTHRWIILAMSCYLIFIFIRTAIHLMFSFAWLLFRKFSVNKLDTFPLVSIIIPCYEEALVIESTIESVFNVQYPNIEVILVDDGSSDLTFSIAKKVSKDRPFRVIYQKNAGKAAALNRGIEEARGDFVLCMDADSRLPEDVLDVSVGHFLKHGNLAAVAGAVKVGNDVNTVTGFQKLEYVTGLNFIKLAQSFVQSVTVVPGPIGLFRRSALSKVGGYHSDTFAEDFDLSLRLLTAGYSIVFEPRMYAVTEVPDTLYALMKQRYRWSRGIIQAVKKNSNWIWHPFKHTRNFLIVQYILVEGIFIPTCNYVFATATLSIVLTSLSTKIMGYYFTQLLLLDLIVIGYCLIFDGFSLRLLFLGFLNRFTFGLAIEIQRFFSIFEELFDIPMNWAKLNRKGIK